MNYYQFHIGDYITNTVHLSDLEDLAYRRLLDLYYQTEQPIPIDIPWVSRRLRLGSGVVESVLNEFFELSEDGHRNARCDEEIANYHAFISKQKANGRKGGRPQKNPAKTHGLTVGKPNETQKNPNQLPLPTTQLPEEEKKVPKKTKPAMHDDAVKNAAIPDSLNFPVFVDVWNDFCQDRRDKGKYMTPNAVKAMLAKLGKSGCSRAVEALNDSLANGWTGVFPEKAGGLSTTAPSNKPKDYSL